MEMEIIQKIEHKDEIKFKSQNTKLLNSASDWSPYWPLWRRNGLSWLVIRSYNHSNLLQEWMKYLKKDVKVKLHFLMSIFIV